MEQIKDILSWKPRLEDIKCTDYCVMSLFCIRPLVSASSDNDKPMASYDLFDEVVCIKGKWISILDIVIKKKIPNLLKLEKYLSKFKVHISNVYSFD